MVITIITIISPIKRILLELPKKRFMERIDVLIDVDAHKTGAKWKEENRFDKKVNS